MAPAGLSKWNKSVSDRHGRWKVLEFLKDTSEDIHYIHFIGDHRTIPTKYGIQKHQESINSTSTRMEIKDLARPYVTFI
jgi:hypothetical protein